MRSCVHELVTGTRFRPGIFAFTVRSPGLELATFKVQRPALTNSTTSAVENGFRLPTHLTAPTPAPSRVTPWERDQGSYIDRYFDRLNYVPSIQRPSPLPPSHPAGPLARWLAPANSVQPPASDTTTSTTHQRELHGHQPDLQHATPYSRLQTQHDLHPPDRSEMLNRGLAPSDTPPLSAATPLTFRPRLLHYINSGLAWFAGTVRRHRHKGWDRLGDAPTTRPLEQPQPPSPHSPPPRGGPRPPPTLPGARGGPRPPPLP